MNMNKNGTISANQRAKLLAGFVAIAMVVCVLCAVLPSSDAVDQETTGTTDVLRVTVDGQATTYTYAELTTAVNAINAATGNVTVDVLNDFTANLTGVESTKAAIVLSNNNPDAAITINGNNHTITGFGTVSQGVSANIINIEYSAADFTISDLVIDGNNLGHHGLNIYDVEGTVTLDGITSTNNTATGITLNQAENVVANGVTVTNNPWGAINVDNGSNLDINGNNNLGDGFQIWSEDANTTETGSSVTGDAFDDYQYGWTKVAADPDDDVTNGAIWFANGTITGDFVLDEGNSITIPADKTLTVAEGATVTIAGEDDSKSTLTINGTLDNNGSLVLSGGSVANTGTITGDGDVSGTNGGTNAEPLYLDMPDGSTYKVNISTTGGQRILDFTVYHFTYNGNDYQYGVYVEPVYYPGPDGTIDVKQLQLVWRALPSVEGTTLAFGTVEYRWFDGHDDYLGALQAEGAPNARTYTDVIYFSANVSCLSDSDYAFEKGALIEYLDLTILPLEYTVSNVQMTGWVEGDYQGQEPTFTVTDNNNNKLTTGFTSSWELYEDAACEKLIPADQYNTLEHGKYYVKVTVTPDDPNNYVISDKSTLTGIVEVDVSIEPTEITFAPITNEDSNEIFGIGSNFYQNNVKFNDDGEGKLRVTGQLISLNTTDDKSVWDKLVGTGVTVNAATSGYFLVFTVEGVGFDITDSGVDAGLISDKLNGLTATQITTDLDNGKLYYIAFINSLPADGTADIVPGMVSLGYEADRDGDNGLTGEAFDTKEYSSVSYDIDLTYLNLYGIILIDEGKNDTYVTYLKEGEWFQFPSGAGDNFTHWSTEADCANANRVFPADAIFQVGPDYDNGDYTIEFTAQYGGSTTPGAPATDVYVGIIKDDANEQFVVTLVGTTANGGYGYIPVGSVTLTYTYLVEQTIAGQTYYRPVSVDVTLPVSEGQMIVEFPEIEGFATLISAEVTYGADDETADGNNSAIYTPNLTATTE